MEELENIKNDQSFLCGKCDERFENFTQFDYHMKSHIDNEKKYQCKTCQRCFKYSKDLKVHERYHTGKKPFKCKVCGKCFTNNQYLTLHSRIHTGEKPY